MYHTSCTLENRGLMSPRHVLCQAHCHIYILQGLVKSCLSTGRCFFSKDLQPHFQRSRPYSSTIFSRTFFVLFFFLRSGKSASNTTLDWLNQIVVLSNAITSKS